MLKNVICAAALLLIAATTRGAVAPDETPGRPGEWGFKPAEGSEIPVTPPGFCWRPQKGAATYTVQCSRSAEFADVVYEANGITYNVHCPPRVFEAGDWHWRFRFVNKKGDASAWSKIRTFTVAADATPMPLPGRDELLGRLPTSHPRLWVRPSRWTISAPAPRPT